MQNYSIVWKTFQVLRWGGGFAAHLFPTDNHLIGTETRLNEIKLQLSYNTKTKQQLYKVYIIYKQN